MILIHGVLNFFCACCSRANISSLSNTLQSSAVSHSFDKVFLQLGHVALTCFSTPITNTAASVVFVDFCNHTSARHSPDSLCWHVRLFFFLGSFAVDETLSGALLSPTDLTCGLTLHLLSPSLLWFHLTQIHHYCRYWNMSPFEYYGHNLVSRHKHRVQHPTVAVLSSNWFMQLKCWKHRTRSSNTVQSNSEK